MYPESVAKSIKGKIFTFGSYRLGVNFSGADIDALLVGPKFISRDEFFDDFLAFLSQNPLAEEIHAVPKAFVPVLKMKFCQVEIDLLFASVDLMSIPHDFCLSENSDQILRNMDERDVRSVNGVRVTDDILRLVHDKKTFRAALKIVRIWAKRRCIYSNAMGFFGGVSWAILVARICQLWPLATVSTIVINFFKFYGLKWPWPSPVVLKEVEESALLHLVQWDPRVNPADQNHVMPILTPSYPSQNSTYNVCDSHKRFIVDQMQKALEVLRLVVAKETSAAALFKPLFFFSYRHYLVVTFRCPGDRKQFREESALIESKLRLLVQYLEANAFVEFALLYLRSYDRPGGDDNPSPSATATANETVTRRWFIGLELRKVDKNLYLVDEINRFKNVVKVDLDVSYSRRSTLAAHWLPQDEVDRIREKVQQANAAASRKRSSDAAAAAAVAMAASMVATATTTTVAMGDEASSEAVKRVKLAVEQDVTSSSTVVAKCSSTEDSAQLRAMSAVSSTTEKEEEEGASLGMEAVAEEAGSDPAVVTEPGAAVGEEQSADSAIADDTQ